MINNIKKKAAFFFIPAFILIFVSCSGKQSEPEIASVNGAPIPVKEFQKEVTLAAKRDPSLRLSEEALEHQLHTIIDRKLLIQEAVRKGISQDEHFLDSIKQHWEQTLIRELINARSKEWSERLFVTDDEVNAHYSRMKNRLTLKVIYVEDSKGAERVMADLRKGASVKGAEILGPLLIDDIRLSNPLYDAFSLKAGEIKAIKGREDYIVVEAVKKEPVATPELSSIYKEIEAGLLEQKKEKALEEWLAELNKNSVIKIDKELLKKVSDER